MEFKIKHWIAIGPSKSGKSTLMDSDEYVPYQLRNGIMINRDHKALTKAKYGNFKMENQTNPCFFHMDSDYVIEEPLRNLVKLGLVNHVYITVRKDHEMRLLNRKKYTRRTHRNAERLSQIFIKNIKKLTKYFSDNNIDYTIIGLINHQRKELTLDQALGVITLTDQGIKQARKWCKEYNNQAEEYSHIVFPDGTIKTSELAVSHEQTFDFIFNLLDLKDWKLLDIGCAYGSAGVAGMRHGAKHVVGVEMRPRAMEAKNNLEKAGNMVGATSYVHHAKLEDISLDGEFDVVLVLNFLHWFKSPLVILKKIIPHVGRYLVLELPPVLHVSKIKRDAFIKSCSIYFNKTTEYESKWKPEEKRRLIIFEK